MIDWLKARQIFQQPETVKIQRQDSQPIGVRTRNNPQNLSTSFYGHMTIFAPTV